MGSAEKNYASLTSWAIDLGASLHASVAIQRDSETGASFKVRPSSDENLKVNPGDEVVTCPMSITLSYLNTLPNPPPGFRKDNQAFPERFLAEIPPHVIGRFLLIKEYLSGSSSFWYPYIRTLPQPENVSSWSLPPFWPASDQELLEGTNLDVSIHEIKAQLKGEFKAARKFLEQVSWSHWSDYTRILYNWAYCIFASRSFMPSLVVPTRDAVGLPDGCKWDDFSLLLPLFDIGNHSITAKVSWEVDSSKGICRLVTRSGYEPGEQVFNNYGMKTNSQLLLGYGFMIPETEHLHNDYIHLRKRVEQEQASAGEENPQEYLLSLLPMTDPSSILGRALQPISLEILSSTNDVRVLSPWTHVQESMILDLVLAQAPRLLEEGNSANRVEILRQFLTGEVASSGLQSLLEQTVAIVQHKTLQELERLEETEFEVDGACEEDLTREQRLALVYRRQCKRVLHGVLASIEEFGYEDGGSH